MKYTPVIIFTLMDSFYFKPGPQFITEPYYISSKLYSILSKLCSKSGISSVRLIKIALRIRAEKDSSVNVLTANANGVSILKKLFVKVI